MKIAIWLLSVALLAPGVVMANGCPSLVKEIDEILAGRPDLDEETMVDEESKKSVTQLRNLGEELHKSGQHSESMKVLGQALELLAKET